MEVEIVKGLYMKRYRTYYRVQGGGLNGQQTGKDMEVKVNGSWGFKSIHRI